MTSPAVTYIVSAFDRPVSLRMTLASILNQNDHDFEIIVADNSKTHLNQSTAMMFANLHLRDINIAYLDTASLASSPGWDCYWSAEAAAKEAKGEFFVFPSDDSYYVPTFQEKMLGAARENDWQLTYCDMLYDGRARADKAYHHKVVAPRVCEIDKTCFMIHRDVWIGFPTKPQTYSASCCDGEMIEEVVRRGARHGRVADILCVHS